VKIKIADTFDMEEMTINFEAPCVAGSLVPLGHSAHPGQTQRHHVSIISAAGRCSAQLISLGFVV
jgi:hypothetical protein